MEGVSHEVASLAGTWRLNKLIAIYDDNGISIDGHVKGWFNDDTARRFEAYGWNVIGPVDGHDVDAVDRALAAARAETQRPTLVIARTVIGKGSPGRAGSEKAHGEALGEAEIAATRAAIGWPHAPFVVPRDVSAAWDARARGRRLESAWNERFDAYARQFPREAAELKRRVAGDLPREYATTLTAAIDAAAAKRETLATRKASQLALEALAPALPEFLGGSADLTGSNLTKWSKAKALTPEALDGRHIHYGVREFGMSAIANGIALHGGFIPFVGTFLVFSDYARNAVRMSALMKQRVIYVFTHDSIGLGEDGPTHQAVEHASSLRLIPNLDVWRPADPVETLVAWAAAIERRDGPTSLLLSRQNVAYVAGARDIADVRRGAYVLSGGNGRRAARARSADRDRLRTAARRRGAAGAGGFRHAGARRVHAIDLGVRSPECRVQVERAAATRAAHCDRGRRHGLLVEVRSRRRCGDRSRSLRRLRAGRRRFQAFRVHGRQRRRHRERSHRRGEKEVTIKVAINGYGRIGRNILRAHYEGGKKHDIQIVAINDLGDPQTNAHLTKYDTTHGTFPGTVAVDGDSMVVNGDRIKVLANRNPAELPWAALGVDVVLECTGFFTSKEKASAHLKGGAKKVIISAPGGKDVDATIVYGVNHGVLKATHTVISNASCTTNCLAPLVKPLHEKIGLVNGLMTTVHAYTNDQVLTDVYHEDLRRARAAAHNMIPTKTGAAAAVGLVMPELNGKLDGYAIRVPTINVSIVDLSFIAARDTTADEVNSIMKAAAAGELKGVLGYNTDPLVSSDFNHDARSSIFDATLTKVSGRLVKVSSWYDNEWGFSNRMLDTTVALMAAK